MARRRTRSSESGGELSGRSMTGFGAGRAESRGVRVDVEIKSANARFLDLTFKLPRLYAGFEPELRELLGRSLQRGRVEVTIGRTEQARMSSSVTFRSDLFSSAVAVYRRAFREAQCDTVEARIGAVRDVLARREVLSIGEETGDARRERRLVFAACGDALTALVSMRSEEGRRLVTDLAARLTNLEMIRRTIGERAAVAPEAARRRLEARLRKLAPDVVVDPQRLAAEVALAADKVDITEELVRIDSHVAQCAVALREPGAARKLEFLLQEFGREFNTIGSKAQDAAVQADVVSAKTELEKMREQAQNLE